MSTTGTGRGAVTDSHTGWDCPNGASLMVGATGPGRGTLPAHHGTIYVCADHQAQAEARITAAGHQPDTRPAPPAHRWDPWPCGHITTYGDNGPHLADTLTTPAVVHACPPDGSGLTPCCRCSPIELPTTDRMTEHAADVTCTAGADTEPASTAARADPIEQALNRLIPGARHTVTVTVAERTPDGATHTWTSTAAGLANRLRDAVHHQAAAALREAADHINALPQDYELDPGRGECADLLRTIADQTTGATS